MTLDTASPEGHTHSDACYTEQKVLICSLEEHTHSGECFESKTDADDDTKSEDNKPFDPNGKDYGDLSGSITAVEVVKKPEVFSQAAASGTGVQASPLLRDVLNSTSTLGVNKVTSTANETKYDANTDKFLSKIRLDFKVTGAEIAASNNDFVYELPDGIIPGENVDLDKEYLNNDGGHAFNYYFRKDSEGKYYIEVNFLEGFDIPEGETATGYIAFNAQIDKSAANDEDGININFGGDLTLDIPEDEITYPQNSTGNSDVYSSKSGSYSIAENAVKYTVTVYSKKGSGSEITFTDAIGNLSASGLEIESSNIEVYKAIVPFHNYSWGTNIGTAEKTEEKVDIGTDIGTDGSFEFTLPELQEGSQVNDTTTNCNAYVIEYTYNLKDIGDDMAESLKNGIKLDNSVKLKANSSPDVEISTDSSKTVNVKNNNAALVQKNGYISDDKAVWTITAGNGTKSLNGYSFKDNMLAQAEDLSIVPERGFNYIKDESGVITGISFVEGSESLYTIEYNTPANGWNDKITNTAHLYDKDNKEVGTDSSTVEVRAGSVNKSDGSVVEENDGVKTLEWTVSVEIPEGGLPAGEIADEIWNSDKGHYMTYQDIQDFIEALNANEILGDKYSNLQFQGTDWQWYTVDKLTADKNYKGYKFNISEIKAEEYRGLEFKYTTTLDTANVQESVYYENQITVAGRSDKGGYQFNKNVIKMDGNGRKGTTSKKDKDGNVTWVIQANLDRVVTDDLVITDSLPAAVDLTKLEVSIENYNSAYTEISKDGTSNVKGMQLVTTVDEDNKAVTVIKSSDGTQLPTCLQAGGKIFLRYTCKVKEDEMPQEGTQLVLDLSNNAEVELNGEPYGTADQSQRVTVGEETEKVDKSYSWDKDNQIISYAVKINPGGVQLAPDGEKYYELKDTLIYRDNSIYSGTYRELELDLSSVKLYNMVQDDSGNYVKGSLIPADNWELVSYNTETDGTEIRKIINAKIPDKSPVILEYSYLVVKFEPVSWDTKLFDSNKVEIKDQILGDKSKTTCNTDWSQSGTSAGISLGYTVYKYAQDKLSNGLQGAVFELYQYDSASGQYINTQKRYTTNAEGYIKLSFANDKLSNNTMYYLVEVLPPTGYELPKEVSPMYFYAKDDSENEAEPNMPDPMPEGAVNLAEGKNSALSHNVANTEMSTTAVNVSKSWLKENGEADTAGEDVEFELLRYYKPRSQADNSDLVKVSYDIARSYYPNYTKTMSVKKGTKVKLQLTQDEGLTEGWVHVPALEVYNNGLIVANISEQNVNSVDSNAVWESNGKVYTYVFTADKDTSITGSITAYGHTNLDVSMSISDDDKDFIVTSIDRLGLGYTLDGSATQTYTLNAGNSWQQYIDDLPVAGNVNGEYCDYVYVVREKPVPGYVTTYTVSEGKVAINNTKTDKKLITVVKKWFGTGGSQITKAEGEITFKLYRKAAAEGGADELVGTYTISAPTWQLNLDADSLGEGSYYVVEDSLQGYITTYDNNHGIAQGTITINNRETNAFTLPETGGKGTTAYTMGGALILICAAYLLYKKYEKRGSIL